MLPGADLHFQELADWYLDLISVKKLASYNRIEVVLRNFNAVFGNRLLDNVTLVDLENYQAKREKEGIAPATIDMELAIPKTMVTKAFDNDMVDGDVLKPFRKLKKKLKKGSNARKRILTFDEYLKLKSSASQHIRPLIIVGYNTAMRSGELRVLQWSHIDKKEMVIRLPAELVKEDKPKTIPINHHVAEVLDILPRSLSNDFVFTAKGKPFKDGWAICWAFKMACKKAGIPYGRKEPNGITIHDLRRTVKTNMLDAGVDKVYRDLILGHSLKGMDVHYIAHSDETLKRAMDKYTKWLDKKLADAAVGQQKVNKLQDISL